jgi:hypothetical protein
MPAAHLRTLLRGLAPLVATSLGALALAAPPADHAATRGSSAVDRALESRARVSGRAASALDMAPGATAADRAALRGSGHAAAGANTAAAGGPAPGAAASFGIETSLQKRGPASPQSGTGRVGRELRADVTTRGAATTARSLDRPGDVSSRAGLRLGWMKQTKERLEGRPLSDTTGTARVEGTPGRGRDPEFHLSRADRLLAHRLAQIDRMRDAALENDDESLLHQADKLEALARAQYTQRTTGERTVGATMRDFNHPPETTEPEPGTDPAGDPTGADPEITPTGGTADPVAEVEMPVSNE